MNRCLYLAKKGLGTTYPNPMVGCVIVYDNRVIGEGWHQRSGDPHAEVNAINSVADKTLLKASTLYVNLEPCSHYGKTPPCADLIIKHKIPQVAIATTDNFERVNGKGIDKLKKAGIAVHLSLLQNEAQGLNKRFFTFNYLKRPYVILKWAQTADAFIATKHQETGKAFKISDKYSHQLAHKWRAEEQAILIGKNTALKDEPSLTTRNWKGSSPIKLVIDLNLEIPKEAKVFNNEACYVFADKRASNKKHPAHIHFIDRQKPVINQIMDFCYDKNIQSLLVEGGSKTHQSFIDMDIWDEARIFTSEDCLHEGIKSADLQGVQLTSMQLHQDNLVIIKNDQNHFI